MSAILQGGGAFTEIQTGRLARIEDVVGSVGRCTIETHPLGCALLGAPFVHSLEHQAPFWVYNPACRLQHPVPKPAIDWNASEYLSVHTKDGKFEIHGDLRQPQEDYVAEIRAVTEDDLLLTGWNRTKDDEGADRWAHPSVLNGALKMMKHEAAFEYLCYRSMKIQPLVPATA